MKSNPIHVLALALCLGGAVLTLAACGSGPENAADAPALTDCPILSEEEFGGVYITRTIDEFNALGFQYGDSVDVTFSNGYTLEDLPYYNGYYTQNSQPLLVAYPGYPYIKAAINNGDDLWEVAGLTEEDTATVTLSEAGKYLDIQQARDIHYEDDRARFDSDEAFANFRSIQAGNIAPDRIYRSASPCDNQHNRAPYVDRLMADAGVDFILNLADTPEKIQGYLAGEDFDSPYFLSLYEAGKVAPLALNTNFLSPAFQSKLADGLNTMAQSPGPYLIHCTEGKDRTGFVCMLLEALAGAGYEEIVEDYMITYDNYYHITLQSDPDRYHTIVENVLDPMVRLVAGREDGDLDQIDLAAGAADFLLGAGMTQAEIDALLARITG